MKLSEKQRLFTSNVGKLICWAFEHGYELTGGDWYRPVEMQALYIERGRSRTMNSKHLKRLAVDFNLFLEGKYQRSTEAYRPLGEYWKSLHPENVWGGDWLSFPDGGHFEYGG